MNNLGWLALGLDDVKFITSIQDIRRDYVSNRLRMKRDTLEPNRVNVYEKYGNLKGFWVRDTQNFFCIVIVRSA